VTDGYRAARDLALSRGLAATVDQRLDWLEGMLEVARASGALQREVERRRQELERLWGRGNASGSSNDAPGHSR
jgi:hypothetical protein